VKISANPLPAVDSRKQLWLSVGVGVATALLLAAPPPSAANVLPESLLLMHVQPVGAGCATAITNCDQIVGGVSEVGTWEFLLYFWPIAWQQTHDPIDIGAIDCELHWPEAWEFVEGQMCDHWGDELYLSSPPYHLNYDFAPDWGWWDCPDLPIGDEEVFLVARFVFDATEPGSFGCWYWGNTVTLNCAEPLTSDPWSDPAEVACNISYGATCYHGNGSDCWVYFDCPPMVLNAPLGGMATGQCELQSEWCDIWSVTSLTEWLAFEATYEDPRHAHLTVIADASGLAPGTHKGWVRATAPAVCQCLEVTLIVSETTPTTSPSWGAIKAFY
jgi:hypothetical protein